MNSMPGILEGETREPGNIPNPDDIGLEELNTDIVRNAGIAERADWGLERSFGSHENAVKPEEVRDRGMEIARSMEDDPGAIERRQQVFRYFMDNDEARDFLLEDGMPAEDVLAKKRRGEDWESLYDRRVNSVDKYISFFEDLGGHLQNPDAPEAIEDYAAEIEEFMSSGEFQQFEEILEDVDGPTETTVEISLPMEREKTYDDDWFTSGSARIRSELRSGREVTARDGRSWSDNWRDFPYRSLVEDLISQVQEETGVRARIWHSPIDVELHIDEEEETVEAKASVERRSLKKWASDLVGEAETEIIETELGLGYEDLDEYRLQRAIKEAKANALSKEIEIKYTGTLREPGALDRVRGSVAELKYIAAAAEYMNQLEEEGAPLTMPETSEEGLTAIRGILEPNTVASRGWEEVVGNDVNSSQEETLYLITGPNDGGKTTYMNAVGLSQAMYQTGMPVLADDAEMTPRDAVLTHFIQKDDIERNQSRYVNELSRIEEVFKQATPDSLVLIDEPFSGTAPEEGAFQLDGVLRALEDLGSTTYASTHYHSVPVPELDQELDSYRKGSETLPELIEGRPHSQNLHAATTENMPGQEPEPTYRIIPGYSTVSEGRAVAEELGADPESLRAMLGERDDIDFPAA